MKLMRKDFEKSTIENNRMGDFLNGICIVGALCSRKSAMITDGINLYVFEGKGQSENA